MRRADGDADDVDDSGGVGRAIGGIADGGDGGGDLRAGDVAGGAPQQKLSARRGGSRVDGRGGDGRGRDVTGGSPRRAGRGVDERGEEGRGGDVAGGAPRRKLSARRNGRGVDRRAGDVAGVGADERGEEGREGDVAGGAWSGLNLLLAAADARRGGRGGDGRGDDGCGDDGRGVDVTGNAPGGGDVSGGGDASGGEAGLNLLLAAADASRDGRGVDGRRDDGCGDDGRSVDVVGNAPGGGDASGGAPAAPAAPGPRKRGRPKKEKGRGKRRKLGFDKNIKWRNRWSKTEPVEEVKVTLRKVGIEQWEVVSPSPNQQSADPSVDDGNDGRPTSGRKRGRPEDEEETRKTKSRGSNLERFRKGRGVDYARLIVKPSERRPWANVSPSPGPSKPAATVTPPRDSSFVRMDTVSQQDRRIAITVYFLEAMDAPPEKEDPQTAAWISKELKIPRGSTQAIKQVIRDARHPS